MIKKAMLVTLIISLSVMSYVYAESEKVDRSQQITEFRVPIYDKEGIMKAQVFGDFAVVMPDGKIEITGLLMELYKKGDVDYVITSPECLLNRMTHFGVSDSPIRITQKNMVITGEGYEIDGNRQGFKINNNVKVILKGARKNIDTGDIE